MRMNISFSVLSPPLIAQASHKPSFALGAESQVWLSPTPYARGADLAGGARGRRARRRIRALAGMRESRVTASGSGEPSGATPLLYSEQ